MQLSLVRSFVQRSSKTCFLSSFCLLRAASQYVVMLFADVPSKCSVLSGKCPSLISGILGLISFIFFDLSS